MISYNLQYEQIGLATEKPGILTGLLLNNLGTIIGDSIMKQIDISTPKHPNTFALVDDADYEWLNQHKWYADKGYDTWYAVRVVSLPNGLRRKTYMHRDILGLKYGDKRQGDHRNHNGLHNWRDNLRICNCSQNHQNMNMNPYKNCSSEYKGVSWYKTRQKWAAEIVVKNHKIRLGYFDNEIRAAKAYDQSAVKYFGEFACLNFPIKKESY